jgi:photosystem II stability/assembly factor-like uncharacterized protein
MTKKDFFVAIAIILSCCHIIKAQWVEVADFPNAGFTDVFFINPDTGFASGGQYADPDLCRTYDGGITWDTIGEEITGCIFSLTFVNDQIGFLSSGQDFDSFIYKTSNQGESWEEVCTLPVPSNAISFPNDSIGYAIPSFTEYAYITKTADCGNTWEEINYYVTEWGGSGITDFQFITENIGYMLYESGVAYRTNDGGMSFEQVYLDFYYNLYALYFLNADTGYMVGEQKDCFLEDSCGVFIKTTNGGLDWTVYALPGHGMDVAFINPDTGYIAADDFILETFDGGENWKISELEFNYYRMLSVQFPDKTTGFAVGNWFTMSGIYKLDYYAGLNSAKPVEKRFRISPNPASDQITLDILNESHLADISIYNQIGQLVLHPMPDQRIIDISSLEPGLYIIDAFSDEWICREEFLICR